MSLPEPTRYEYLTLNLKEGPWPLRVVAAVSMVPVVVMCIGIVVLAVFIVTAMLPYALLAACFGRKA